MKRLAVMLGACLGLAAPAGAQSSARDSLLALDSLWAHAYAANDTVAARRLMAEDFIFTGPAGRTKDRETEMGDIRPSPNGHVEYFRTREVDVRLRPSTAAVIGIVEWLWVSGEQRGEARFRYTATYARGGPLGWEMIALHLGPMPRPAQ